MKYTLPPGTPKGQAEAITADEKLITVGAGAGTGKTWVLTERYVRLLIDDDELLPSEILTLTYTEAAAGEMKTRITSRVESALKDFDDPERRRIVLDGLSDLWISTIHSFAARLIRESGLSLDIDPRASVITTQQEQDFWDNIAGALEFANLRELADAYGDKELQDLAKSLDRDEDFSAGVAKWRAGTLSRFARDFAELHASSGRTWREVLGWLENDSLIASAKKQVREILLPEWREVWKIFSSIPELPMPKAKNPDGAGVIFNNMLAGYRGRKDDEQTLQSFYTDIAQAKGGNGQPFTALKEHLGGETFSKWRDNRPKAAREITPEFDEPLIEQELTMRKTLLKFCALSWAMWDNMKTRRGLLSFSDMINHARKAVSDGAVSRKFKYILVDEFQDTDPLQFSMIESLAGEGVKLFAVGDPKQSIYRFRHADPSLFAKTIRNSDRKVELDTSFRTRAELLSRINTLFSQIWLGGLGKTEPMNQLHYQRINPVETDSERASGTMHDFMIIVSKDSRSTLEQARKNLADQLARRIAECVQSGLTIWDKKDRVIRPVKFSDFAVLTPSRSIYPVLEESLESFGIKSIQDKSTDYFARGEINDAVSLLRAAADFNDDFAVSGWLMSPFSGVTEDDALSLLLQVDENTRPIELIRESLPEAYSRLEYYSLVGEHEGPAGLLEIFDRDRKWLSAYKPADRMRILRNIRLAVHIAREFQHSGTASLTACAEWLTRSVRSEVPFEEPAWHDEKENAVRLGTVHSAKGLEYPVAVVFDSRVKKKTNTDQLRPSRELGLAFTNLPDEVTKGGEIKPRLSAWERLLSEEGEEEEQTRLFYVAATRAQDSLIFCGMIDEESGEPHPHTWTKLLLENDTETERITAHEIPEHVQQKLTQEEDSVPMKPVETVKAKNSLRQISASSFSLYEWCPFAWRRTYRQGLSLAWEDPAEKAEDYDGYTGGAELGSLAHWILARWPKTDEDFEAGLDYHLHDKEVLSRLPGYLRPAWRNNDKKKDSELRNWLLKFAESEPGVMLRTRRDVEREKVFRLPLSESVSLAGAIDAVWGNNIIDYKITSIDRTPPGLYESQLEFYALVLHMMTGAESVNTTIVFLKDGGTETRVVSDFGKIRDRVTDAAEVCASGPYVPRHEHCALCPFKKGCVNHE